MLLPPVLLIPLTLLPPDPAAGLATTTASLTLLLPSPPCYCHTLPATAIPTAADSLMSNVGNTLAAACNFFINNFIW